MLAGDTALLYQNSRIERTCQAELKQAWGDWVKDLANWDWFMTGTFREPSQEEQRRGYTQRGWHYASTAWNKFLEALPAPLGVEHWFRAFEFEKWRGVPHIHALISGVKDLRRDEAWNWWFKHYGFARILPYDRELGAGYYLCKYVTKELGDIRFSPNLKVDLTKR